MNSLDGPFPKLELQSPDVSTEGPLWFPHAKAGPDRAFQRRALPIDDDYESGPGATRWLGAARRSLIEPTRHDLAACSAEASFGMSRRSRVAARGSSGIAGYRAAKPRSWSPETAGPRRYAAGATTLHVA